MSKHYLSASALLIAAGLSVATATGTPLAQKGSMATVKSVGMHPLTVNVENPLPIDRADAAKKHNFSQVPNSKLILPANPLEEKRNQAAKSATAAARALDANIDLRGQMLYHDAWTETTWKNFQGFYSIPHTSSESFYLRGLTGIGMNWGGYYDPATKIFHGVASDWSLSQGTISYCYNVAYDTESWELVQADAMYNNAMCAFSVAYDVTEETPYGYFVSPAGQLMWATADYEAGKTYEIESYDFSEFGDRVLYLLACDDEGQFYGINLDAKLVKIDKETGEQTVVGQTTVPVDYKGGCTINSRNHTMLVTSTGFDYDMFAHTGTSGLWEVNLETGASEKLATFTGDIMMMNLYVEATASEKAPNAPELTVTAPEGSMTATYEVKMPATLFDGTPMTGSVDWVLTMDGQTIAEGRNMAGAVATGSVEVTTTGNHTFAAYCSNAEGNSPKEVVTVFVGKGMPNATKNVVLKYEDGVLSLTWDAVTTSSDGGYINPAEVTYTITPLEGEAFDVDTNSWSMEMEAPQFRTVYQYSVKANYAGKTTAEVVSNWIAMGAYQTPQDFDMRLGSSDMAIINYGFTVIDADGDGDSMYGKWHSGTIGGASFKVAYARTNQADDYLVTPAIWLEEGQVYEITVPAFTQSATSVSKPQRMRLLAGTAPTVEGLDTELLGETNVCAYENEGYQMKGLYKAPSTGNHYFAVHVNTPRTSAWSYANNTVYVPQISIASGVDAAAPVAATNVSIVPDATGQLKAVINFTTPTVDVSGNTLTNYVPYVVYRNGVQITSNNYTKGGVAKSYTDTSVPERGTYTYEIVCKYNNKTGIVYKKDVYVGPYKAAQPQNVGIVEAFQPGDVMVYWDPVTTDENKSTMPASNMTYMVYKLETVDGVQNLVPMLSEPTKQTHAIFTANEDPEHQRLCEFFVKAANLGNEGGYSRTPYVAVGNAYKIPVLYSNNGDLGNYVMGTGSILGGASFNVFNDGEVESVDGDGQFFGSVCSTTDGRSCFLMTGKIDLINCERPELTYWTYKFDDDDENSIQTKVLVDGEWVNASPAPEYGIAAHKNMVAGKWTKVRYDLTQFKGKQIQLRFDASHYSHNNTLIDNIRVEEIAGKDLFIASIEAPNSVDPNEKFTINVTVGSIGWETANNFMLHLYRDGDLLETRELGGVDYNEEMMVMFTDVLTHFDAADPEAVYSAEIEFDGDVDLTNNISADVKVNRNTTVMPVVNDLAVEQTEEGAHLTWTAYSSDTAEAVEYTETFDEQESWAQTMEGWTFVDKDNEPCYTRFSAILSGIPFANRTKLSWVVWDQSVNTGSTDATQDYTMPHSGTKSLCQFYSYNYVDDDDDYYNPYVNDWAMSPPLTGDAQTIKFWVKGWSPNEKMEVWYATEYTDDTTKFTKVATAGTNGTITATKTWTEYQVELPAGAIRFALRAYYRDDRRMLMVDDVTFTPDLSYGQPVLVGYNVYRNGKKLNDKVLTTGEFTDTKVKDGNHTYHVIGVFDKGVSELSNPALLAYSGLTQVNGDDAVVGVDGSDIVVANATLLPVAIYTVDGKNIHNGLGDIRKPVLPGIYLVQVGSTTYKLLVK